MLALRGSLADTTPGSALTVVVAGGVGVAVAFLIATGVSSAIGPQTQPAGVGLQTSTGGATQLSAAQVRALRVSNCKEIVGGQTTLSAGDKRSLLAQCGANPQAALRSLPTAARRGGLALGTKQCQQGVARADLPASAEQALQAECKAATNSVANGGSGNPSQSTQEQLCRQIVKSQVPPEAQQAALAACAKH